MGGYPITRRPLPITAGDPMMREMLANSYLFGANAPFIEALYEAYLADPSSVEPRWRGYFDELQKLDDNGRDVARAPIEQAFAQLARQSARAQVVVPASSQPVHKQVGVLQLTAAYRFQGARHANVDP